MGRVFVLMFVALLGCKEETAATGSIHQFSECYEKLNTGAISERNVRENCTRESEAAILTSGATTSVRQSEGGWLMRIAANGKSKADFIVTRVTVNLTFYNEAGNSASFTKSQNIWVEPGKFGFLEDIMMHISVDEDSIENIFCTFGPKIPDNYGGCEELKKKAVSNLSDFPWCSQEKEAVSCRSWGLSMDGIRIVN
jgi:hypothetical protein